MVTAGVTISEGGITDTTTIRAYGMDDGGGDGCDLVGVVTDTTSLLPAPTISIYLPVILKDYKR